MLIISPQYETYNEFAQSEDAKMCSVVTDGCNRWNYQDGEMGDPIVACRVTEDFVFSWSCSEYVEGSPLYVNKNYETTIMHTGYIDPLSMQERGVHTAILEQLSIAEMDKIADFSQKYIELRSVYPLEKHARLYASMYATIQKYIDTLRSSVGNNQNRTLLMLQFIQIEIKLLSYDYAPIASAGEVYVCDDVEYTVFRKDYLIDDMMFSVDANDIHVSDGEFFLPNYIASLEVSASGEKYIGYHTETQEAFTFGFKDDTMSVYSDDRLIHTCSR
ncbi:hypothetical protein LAT59_04565 [Candidatus Gracilibacteria bacterium]|nr:hypothetical protein [Candidatus Gracilibacteria bacterium]